ncbi:MAG TPA: glycosyltransferase family 4 protein [Gemmatimonadales bacterium]|nr:glycosyltransferase family 4 protein [Gemmatimonadales bacterium]
MPPARPLRVALMTSAREWRGSGVSFSHIALGLAANGHAVRLLSTVPPVTAGFATTGLPVQELPIHDTGFAEARILGRALETFQSDLLVAETPRDVRLGALASLRGRFRLVYSYNVNRALPPRDPIMRLAYRRVRLTIFRTHSGERAVLQAAPFMGRPPHCAIYEGVNVDVFRPDTEAGRSFRAQHGLGDRPFLLAVGALEWEKRYEWMLDTLARLGPDGPLLMIRGSGSLAGAIRAQAARLGMAVRLLDVLDAKQLAAAYNAATCFVHSCDVETFGLTVAEAMACGRPLVTVAAGALPEVVGDGGILAPPDDQAAFAHAVRDVLAHPERAAARGAAARRRAVEAFSMERMGRAYSEALVQAAAARELPH